MSNKYEIPVLLQSAQFDVQTAADKATLTMPMFRTVIYAVGLTIAGTDTGGATVKFDIRPTAGDDTGRGDGDAGVVVIPASNQAGKVLIDTLKRGTALTPGQQVVVQVTAEGVSALNVIAHLWLQYDPEEVGNLSTVTET